MAIVIPFLLFKGTSDAYLLKISITHDKNRIRSLNLLINCTLALSAPQILPLKDEYTFRFSNFLIIVLRNSSINCWFGIFLIFNSSLLRLPKVYEYALGPAPSEVFISKTLQTIEAIQRWYPSYFGFLATLNALSRNN